MRSTQSGTREPASVKSRIALCFAMFVSHCCVKKIYKIVHNWVYLIPLTSKYFGYMSSSSKSSSKATNIQLVLDTLYPNPVVPLDNLNDFTFLVAVVLSAQTTDGKVNEVTRVLFQHATTPREMASLDPDFVLKIIQPVGLAPKKSQYVVNLSKMLVEKFDSKVPSTYEELEMLPGVGHKTASVIMSQCFGVPSFAVDTHVHRLALRWGISKDQKNVDNVQKDLCNFFPEESWNKVQSTSALCIGVSFFF
jgi:endonuclease III